MDRQLRRKVRQKSVRRRQMLQLRKQPATHLELLSSFRRNWRKRKKRL